MCGKNNNINLSHCKYISTVVNSPPDKLYISHADFGLKKVTFSWSPVAPDCPTVHYNILASNCGSCPTTTNHTTVTCTGVPTDGNTCTFAIQTVVCGNATGDSSDSIRMKISESVPTQPYIYGQPRIIALWSCK